MSIKKSLILYKPFCTGVSLLFLMVIGMMVPDRGYSWFLIQNDSNGVTPWTMNVRSKQIATTEYILSYNIETREDEAFLNQKSSPLFSAGADWINVGIPLGVLTRETADSEFSLDRLIAANLRIKNILDEYFVLKTRTQTALKYLRIPYLEKNTGAGNGHEMGASLRIQKSLRKDMENIVLYGASQTREISRLRIQPWLQTAGKRCDKALEQPESSDWITSSDGYKKQYKKGMGSKGDDDPPRIVLLLFKAVKYIFRHKLEIMLWGGVAVTSTGIMILVFKK